ncbi:hypothetical protein Y1Q_0023191 [Alligator mississippiensis]|uniref:Uncharacterized protein n=1 Tax=Alligator mississippiensis TaxID=8496 RepID=A0A151MZD7_ALLMI|nr:hypothetical protein Y1Q_0023191 [Alligator mississippiensis]
MVMEVKLSKPLLEATKLDQFKKLQSNVPGISEAFQSKICDRKPSDITKILYAGLESLDIHVQSHGKNRSADSKPCTCSIQRCTY